MTADFTRKLWEGRYTKDTLHPFLSLLTYLCRLFLFMLSQVWEYPCLCPSFSNHPSGFSYLLPLSMESMDARCSLIIQHLNVFSPLRNQMFSPWCWLVLYRGQIIKCGYSLIFLRALQLHNTSLRILTHTMGNARASSINKLL